MTRKIFLIGLIALGLAAGVVVVGFLAYWYIDLGRSEARRRLRMEEMHSGKYDFGDQPALFAVAQAIANNDQDAIRAAAKAVPDLQAPGRDDMTLLYFAVRETWQRPQSVEAVKTLLSLGADPNYSSDSRWSFALANAARGSVLVLRAMLEAGGDPNARDVHCRPIILMNWELGHYKSDERARLDLLLDRGADINSIMPEDSWNCAGYPLLLCRTENGRRDSRGYADALHLLERGADPHRAADDGMTLARILMEHREFFAGAPPPEFAPLWEWAEAHGILSEPEDP
jgi:hypothetical protein